MQEDSERQKNEEERLLKIKLQLELEQRRAEEERERRAKEERERQALQEKLKKISSCPAGFNWYKHGFGWRCGGGSHFVSDKQLGDHFTH